MCVHHGDLGAVLPPVRPDDRHLDGDLGVQLADAEPGPRGPAAEAAVRRGSSRPCRGRRSWRPAAGRAMRYSGPELLRLAGRRVASPCIGTAISPELAAKLAGLAAGAAGGWLLSGLLNRAFGWVFLLFNKAFDAATSVYTRMVGGLLRVSVLVLLLYGGLLGLTYWGMTKTPTGFIPPQDKGYLLVNVQLPDSSSLERTQKVMAQVERLARQAAGRVAHPGDRRPVDPDERQRPQFRRDVRDARRFPPPGPRRSDRPGDRRAARGGASGGDQGRPGQRLRGAAGRRPGDRRRLQDRRRGSRRPGLAGDRERRQPDRRELAEAAVRAVALRAVHQLPGQHALALPGHRPRQGQAGRRFDRRAVQHACRSTWARCTSTTSTDSAAPGRSMSRATPTSASRSAT